MDDLKQVTLPPPPLKTEQNFETKKKSVLFRPLASFEKFTSFIYDFMKKRLANLLLSS